MALTTGARLGSYEILDLIGQGGMGQVYRARDPRLGRDVAIKVITAGHDLSPDQLRRFEQEAQAAAALQHPNIVAVHDIGSYDGAPYIVSELLEGTTLRARLESGALPLRKAVDVAVQMAQGLAAAHARRIVHRDLKPDNVFLTRDGHVKILDFGLAKLVAEDPAEATEVVTTRGAAITARGIVMGTAGYMSPEQARGEPIDHRSDIFSFGATLYEMITGRRAFGGRSAADALSAVLREEPPPMTQNGAASVPAPLERIVQACLEKEPDQRLQSAHDLAIALQALGGGSGTGSGAEPAVEIPAASRRPRWRTAAFAAGLAAVMMGTGFVTGRGRPGATAVPTFTRVTFQSGYARNARFGAEPSNLIYSAAWGEVPEQLYTARLGTEGFESMAFGPARLMLAAVAPVTGELAVIRDPATNPSNSLARIGTLARMSPAGGAPRDVLEGVESADWSPDGRELAVVRTVEGKARLEFPIGAVIYETAGWISEIRMSPDGATIAFAEHPLALDDRGWVSAVEVKTRTARRLTPELSSIRGTAWRGREIVFGNGSDVVGIAPDGSRRLLASTTGPAYVCDVASDGTVLVNLVNLRFGTHVLVPGGNERDLSWLDGTIPVGFWPDGRRLLLWEGLRYGAYARDLDGSPAVRLGDGSPMALSPDGKSVLALQHTPMRLAVYPTGAGESRVLPTGRVTRISWGHWTPDGRRAVFSGEAPGEGERIYAVAASGGEPTAIGPPGITLIRMAGEMVSPDGRAVLAVAGAQGYVLVPLDGGEPRPIGGFRDGDQPLGWEPDGNSFLVHEHGTTWPLSLVRVRLASGTREPWRTVTSSQREPFLLGGPVVAISRDRETLAFLVATMRSTLFRIRLAPPQ